MRRGIAMGLVAVVTAGSLAAGAFAGYGDGGKDDGEVKSQISLHNRETGVYEGTVTSTKACRRQRKVKIYHDENENGVDRSDYRIGKDTTDKRGNYEVEGSQAPMGDDVIAVVSGKVLSDGTHCLDDDKTIAALSG